MPFISLLFENEAAYVQWREVVQRTNKEYDQVFTDLNMNYVLEEITKYCFHFPTHYLKNYCKSQQTAKFRQEVMKEIYDCPVLLGKIEDLINQIIILKNQYMEFFKTKHTVQKQYRYLIFLMLYFQCIETIFQVFNQCKSMGLSKFWATFDAHRSCRDYQLLKNTTEDLLSRFHEILDISLHINLNESFIELIYDQPKECIADTVSTLAENLLHTQINTSFSISSSNPISALEVIIIEKLSQKYPDIFHSLEEINNHQVGLLSDHIYEVEEQLYFYVGYIHFVRSMEEKQYKFSFPIYESSRKFICKDAYDASLAIRIIDDEKLSMVSNDIVINGTNGFILTGANQGGKTTYLRSLGLIACLSNNGLMVPAAQCHISYFDNIFTHFNKPEQVGLLQGRLAEEIQRFKDITLQTTEHSLVLMNESFASTMRMDATTISVLSIEKLIDMDCIFGFVTHFYELYEMLGEKHKKRISSLVASINKSANNQRLYKIMKQYSNTLAYAKDIAEACGVTFDKLVDALGGKNDGCY